MDTRVIQLLMELRKQGISDTRVLAALERVPREQFVAEQFLKHAYDNIALPITQGQTISQPYVVAYMTEALQLGDRMKVLEIGTGCGYQAAVLACVATEVYSIERLRGLHDKARDNLRSLRLANLHLLFGDGMAGYAKGAPYAGIIAAAGGDAVPQAWIEQLAVGGRIIAPTVMPDGAQALVVLEKTAREMKQSVLEPVHFVPLKSGIA